MYEYKAVIDRVIDGDTVDVDIQLGCNVVLAKQRVRLHGIDTPESRTRNLEEKVRGLLSKDYLRDKCPKGSTVILVSKERGKFGRILGILFNDENIQTSINDRMIEDGYAVPYTGGNKDELEALHKANKQKLIELGVLEN